MEERAQLYVLPALISYSSVQLYRAHYVMDSYSDIQWVPAHRAHYRGLSHAMTIKYPFSKTVKPVAPRMYGTVSRCCHVRYPDREEKRR